jgi:hypothetical protein
MRLSTSGKSRVRTSGTSFNVLHSQLSMDVGNYLRANSNIHG